MSSFRLKGDSLLFEAVTLLFCFKLKEFLVTFAKANSFLNGSKGEIPILCCLFY